MAIKMSCDSMRCVVMRCGEIFVSWCFGIEAGSSKATISHEHGSLVHGPTSPLQELQNVCTSELTSVFRCSAPLFQLIRFQFSECEKVDSV
jgi:hypothetical protein